ncbi:Pectin lyase-like superfamily protein [Citrus sinensis]|nr:Pectin lyase-like superfamily protein [Citrus sinensis]
MVKFFSSLFIFLFISSINLASSYATTTSYNVLRFGAKGNGVADSTQAFAKAWAAACASTESATINVPKGSSDITFRIDGTLVAPADYCVLGQADNWLSFEGVSGVSIIGGALDAKGSSLWACKASGTNCPDGATVLHNCLLF